MNVLLLLEMAASGRGDEPAITSRGVVLTPNQLLGAAWTASALLAGHDALVFAGTNSMAYPIGLFASAAAEVPFVPLNFRLTTPALVELAERCGHVLVVADSELVAPLSAAGLTVVSSDDFCSRARGEPGSGDAPYDAESTAILLYTSGTTSAPKAAVLRHRHLTSYVIGSVEYGGAGDGETVLVSVPGYHIAGVANLLSNLYLGRRIVYLDQFSAEGWLDAVDTHGITHAMVVPTMLSRICDLLEERPRRAHSLRALSYGGARTPAAVLERAIRLLPEVAFTNAYGLTETSSTIAVLTPDDHRAAADGDAVALRRLSSAGQVLPTIELEVRDDEGNVLGPEEAGEIWVRGEQVSGEYVGLGSRLGPDGWFPTRDNGWVDAGGYLFIEGRADDTIIRGGENIAPTEIEEVLLRHPRIRDCVVVGIPDDEWGQRIAAVVVTSEHATLAAEEVREHARGSLRTSKTPDVVAFVPKLPTTDTGKVLRRVVLERLVGGELAPA